MPTVKILGSYILVLTALIFLVAIFIFKGNMNTFISNKMKEQAGENIKSSMILYVDSAPECLTARKPGFDEMLWYCSNTCTDYT